MKILILGSKGQLGTDIVRVLEENEKGYFAAGRQDADIAKPEEIDRLFDKEKPDAVINCTAFHDMTKCEEDPAVGVNINTISVSSISKKCNELDIKFMTISSDYVFDGKKIEGYTEDDISNPLTWYGKSKLAGEWCALANNPKAFVVRVQSLYGVTGPKGKGLNFVDLMLKLSKERDELKVDQCRMAPTWTYPLAKNMLALLETENYGLYHMSCNGMTSWCEFAKRIMELTGSPVKVTPVANDFFPRDFDRPENTYLIKRNLDKINLNLMPTWEEALKGYLRCKGHKIKQREKV